MPYSDPEKQKAWQREYRRIHKDREHAAQRERNRLHKLSIKDFILNSKFGKPCLDCSGEFPTYVMEYDHRCDEEKLFNLSDASTRGVSKKRLQAEIDKCDLVCANCHRIRSAERGGWYAGDRPLV